MLHHFGPLRVLSSTLFFIYLQKYSFFSPCRLQNDCSKVLVMGSTLDEKLKARWMGVWGRKMDFLSLCKVRKTTEREMMVVWAANAVWCKTSAEELVTLGFFNKTSKHLQTHIWWFATSYNFDGILNVQLSNLPLHFVFKGKNKICLIILNQPLDKKYLHILWSKGEV